MTTLPRKIALLIVDIMEEILRDKKFDTYHTEHTKKIEEIELKYAKLNKLLKLDSYNESDCYGKGN